METKEQPARRALRTRTSTTTPAPPGGAAPSVDVAAPPTPTPTAAGSESPRSEGTRSSRLNNPEFAARHKAFMAKVTAATKGSMDTYLTSEMLSGPAHGKRKLSRGGEDQNTKRRRSNRTNSSGLDVQSDGYCWLCHKEGDVICCETCPRVFHAKCLQLEASPPEDWVCPECILVMTAENMETRSRAMRLLTLDQLCTLLKHALTRMKSVSNVDAFLKPVDPLQFPAYKDYISCPMDIQSMERNIRRKQYGSTEAMLADCKWILHNCIIFNSPSSKLTSIAKSIVKVCRHEMQEIENCPDCYLNAHIKKEVWFTEACRLPHPLVWAKLKGFPYWPGKVMRVTSDNSADIRFFGAHDRAWIPIKDVFLFSKKAPSEIKKKRGNIDNCFVEMDKHIKKLKDRFGRFDYAQHRLQYDPAREAEMLKMLFPNFTPPFDIGKFGRRSRSYSCSGSERSRDGTPTRSDSGEGEEDFVEESKEPTLPLKLKIEIPKLHVSQIGKKKKKGEKASKAMEQESAPVDHGEASDDTKPIVVSEQGSATTNDQCKEEVPQTYEHPQPGDTEAVSELHNHPKLQDTTMEPLAVAAGSKEVAEQDEHTDTQPVAEAANSKETIGHQDPDQQPDTVQQTDQHSDDTVQTNDLMDEEETLPEPSELNTAESAAEGHASKSTDETLGILEPNPTLKDISAASVDESNGLNVEPVAAPKQENAPRPLQSHVSEFVSEESENAKDNVELEDSYQVNADSDEGAFESVHEEALQTTSSHANTCSTPMDTSDLGSKEASDSLDQVSEKSKSSVIPSDQGLTQAEEQTAAGETAWSDEVSRVSTSPPCEVTSTTEAGGKKVEGIIADDNNEKVIVQEHDEIDDVEPMDENVKEDEESTVEEGPVKGVDSESLAAGGVSITVIDRKKLMPKSSEDKEENEEENISVSITRQEKKVEQGRNPEGRRPSQESSARQKGQSTLVATEKVPEETGDDNNILTISKVVSLKDTKEAGARPPSATSLSEGRRSQNSSPSVQSHHAAATPYFQPRMPGFRGPHPMGPRGPMIPMMGPNQTMMMRGQFRGSPGPHHGPPGPMQGRPPGPLNLPPSLPSAAGPVADQLNKVALKLAESIKKGFHDILSEVEVKGSPEAAIKALKMECEKLQWNHQKELVEMRHNADLVVMEMRGTMEQERAKAMQDYKKLAESEKQKAILETKKKQWCALCGKEAIFYCCWNTSYCDYPCQQAHWPAHMSSCAQNSGEATGEEEAVAPPPQPEPIHHPQQQHYLQAQHNHHAARRQQQHMRMPHAATGMVHNPMRGYGMRPQLPFTRPYYM